MPRFLSTLLACLLLAGGMGWADEEGPGEKPVARAQLTIQLGHHNVITQLAATPDGTRLATASLDGTPRIWDTATGRILGTLRGHSGAIGGIDITADGALVVTSGAQGTIRIWDLEAREQLRSFESAGMDPDVLFSPDGRFVVTSGVEGPLQRFETARGKAVQTYDLGDDHATSVSFSPDGRTLLVGMNSGASQILDAESGDTLRTFEKGRRSIDYVLYAPDGKRCITYEQRGAPVLRSCDTGEIISTLGPGGERITGIRFTPDGQSVLISYILESRVYSLTGAGAVRVFPGRRAIITPDSRFVFTVESGDGSFHALQWDFASGKALQRFDGLGHWLNASELCPDGIHVLSWGLVGVPRLWERRTGKEKHRLASMDERLWCLALSPAGRLLVTGHMSGTAKLWDVATGGQIGTLSGHRRLVSAVAFSPDGTRVLTASGAKDLRLWDVAKQEELLRLESEGLRCKQLSFSPDGTSALAICDGNRIVVWDTSTGEQTRQLTVEGRLLTAASFSPDGTQMLAAGPEKLLRLWDVATGDEVRDYEGSVSPLTDLTFSPEGDRFLGAGFDGLARLYDTASGRELTRFDGHADGVTSVAFWPEGGRVFTASKDGTTRLWDEETGRELCAMAAFGDGTWIAFDPEGRYDASHAGDVDSAHFVIGSETLALAQLKERAYDPGLWAKYTGESDEPLLDVSRYKTIQMYPAVTVSPIAEDGRLEVSLTNRGGGIGRVSILVNGKEIEADARGDTIDPEADRATVTVDLGALPALRPGEANTVEVIAWNQGGYLSSPRGAALTWEAPGKEHTQPPELWAIVCGVSDYRGDAIDLRFASKDAEDTADALRLGGSALFGPDRTHVRVLSTSGAPGTVRPTRQSLEAAFDWATAAGPDDVLVIYLAGHGVNRSGADGDFHFLLADATSADLSDPEVRRQTAVSSRELTALINRVPATRRQVLILDTCASGRAIEKLTEERQVPSSQIRALDRVKDRTGMFVLAGCAADSVSFEATRYGQGLLTYSLLLGMRGGALRDDEYIDVESLFGFAADQVPLMAEDLGGIQRPLIAVPRGGASFDIGRVPPERRHEIPLEPVKPVFVRPAFMDRRSRTAHELVRAVSDALRDASASRGEQSLVFVDAAEMPSAYELSGTYAVEGDTAEVEVFVWQGEREVATFRISGDNDALPALATQIVHRARAAIGH